MIASGVPFMKSATSELWSSSWILSLYVTPLPFVLIRNSWMLPCFQRLEQRRVDQLVLLDP